MLLMGIAWIYVVAMVAVVELTGVDGSWLRALATLLVWGVLPLGLVGYLWLAPARRRRRREAASVVPAGSATPAGSADEADRGGHAPGDAVAPVREEP